MNAYKEEQNKTQAMDMKFLRSIDGKIRSDRNQTVKEETN
jgi:hypothetical protein